MKVLIVTNMYPSPERPAYGIFVQEQVDSLREAGVDLDLFSFAFNGRGGIKGYLKATQALRRTVREEHYDLIHAHYGLTGMVARMQTRCPLVVTFHGSDLIGKVFRYNFTGVATLIGSRMVSLLATRCIVVADALRSKLWTRSAVTIPMGVDLSLFKPMPSREAKEQLGLDNDRQCVLFVAHPQNPIKRFDIAQAAVGLLKADGFNVELLPVYDVPHRLIPSYMNASDVLVLTSMHEASPCVVKEALACNLSIVSVNVGDVAKRIEGVSGCYLCDRTPEDVAAKLRKALVDGHRTNGREKALDLSLQSVAQQVIAVYQEVLESGKGK